MKKILLFVLALTVIPVGVDAQDTPSASCADINMASPLKDLRTCAEQGNAIAQGTLGFKYSVGNGVPEDDAEAVRWFRLAAEQGNAGAQFYLGNMYSRGDGVPEDDAEAARWLRLAAEQGNALAQYNLGFIYDSGRGVASVHKLISLAQHSTRKHYPGAHRVEVMLNGAVHPGDEFEIV